MLDTNAALDALLFDDASMRALMLEVRAARLQWVVTPRMRDEFLHVLARPMLAKYITDGERTLSDFDRLANVRDETTPGRDPRLVCRDPDDQVFIELALRERASWLVTRDRDLLCLAARARRLNLQILTPPAWIARQAPAV